MCIYIYRRANACSQIGRRICMHAMGHRIFDKFVIPAFHSFREDSQSAPSTPPDQPLGANGAIEMARKGNMDWCSRACEKDRRSSQQVAQRCGYNALKREVLDP